MTEVTLSPIHINTSYERPEMPVGLAGVMELVAGSEEKLANYHSLSEVIKDFDTTTDVYIDASNYFTNDNSPLFQVLTYKQGDMDSLTKALSKYYYSGAQYFLIRANNSANGANTNDITTASNFIESQDNKELVVDVPFGGQDLHDFMSKLNISGNKATLVVSLDGQHLGSAFLADFANAELGTDAALVNNLSNVQPQDKYEFSVDTLNKFYTPNRVATYAVRHNVNMMTSGVTQSGDQLQAIVVRDAVSDYISDKLMNVLLQNRGHIAYDNDGIGLFVSAVHEALESFAKRNLITYDPADIKSVDASNISANKKATGALTGISWKYTPMFTIDDATFNQTVVLPQIY